uniref:Uncharacterized protein n=1 Tax=Oryza glumipatula TaxID=40148 RepID=A0A0D9ZGS7_9ORYZ
MGLSSLDKGPGPNDIIVAAVAGRGRDIAWVKVEGVDEAIGGRGGELMGGEGWAVRGREAEEGTPSLRRGHSCSGTDEEKRK